MEVGRTRAIKRQFLCGNLLHALRLVLRHVVALIYVGVVLPIECACQEKTEILESKPNHIAC